MQKQFLSIFWGTKYSPDYVNRLFAMVERNTTGPLKIYFITDKTKGIRPEIICNPQPQIGCDMPLRTKGIWGKSRLWLEDLGNLSGPVLFMDLDLVVTGNLDEFFEVGEDDDVILARNANTPLEKLGQTSIFRFPIGKLAPLREMFLSDPQAIADKYRFEQRFVTRNAPDGIKFWPKGWISNYKWHCVPTFPLNYFIAPNLPVKSKIVIFPGPLNPPDAIAGRWRANSAVQCQIEHIYAGLRGKRDEGLFRHIRHFILPAPWVEKYWQQ
jgi:hypothetical protein